MDEFTKHRIRKHGATRAEGINVILDDLTIARGMVVEMRAEAHEHGLATVEEWLVKADDALTGVVAAAERAK